ncbi:MAG: ATP synthase F1 subunit delta [Planctomycetia bacterium]|nr:ATP synthase F1 subunit delta [Planctomycetia bacterium]
MSTDAAKQETTLDVGAQRVAAVYARALLAAAQKAGQVTQVLAELDSFVADVLDRFPRFEAVLSSAIIAHEDKEQLLDHTLGKQASPLLLNFLKVLSRHERLGVLRYVHKAMHELVTELRGLVRVRVSTASPLDEALAEQITAAVKGFTGGEPLLERRIDPDLIGGLVLQVGDTVYDGSVSAQLARLRTRMIDRSVYEIQSRRDRFGTGSGD